MNDCDGLLRKARRSKNHNDWIRYEKFKNRINNVIKRVKSKYHKNLLDENISKPEVFLKHIKTLFPTKIKQICSKSFIINDIATTNENPLGAQPGLGTQPHYEVPGNLRVELVRFLVFLKT